MLRIFTFLLLSLITLSARGQAWEAGITAGAAGYMGDLNQRNPLQVGGPVGGAFVKKNFSPYLAAKVSFMSGWISASDQHASNADDRNRNLSFLTYLNELSGVAEFNFLEYRPGMFERSYTPYVFLGAGAVAYSPTAKASDGNRYDLRSGRTEGEVTPYAKVALAIPFGVGFKYNFSGKLSLIADAGYRYVNTDYLDDVSGKYVNPASFTNDVARGLADRRLDSQQGSFGMQRGDQRSHDGYMFFTVSLSYTWLTERCYFR